MPKRSGKSSESLLEKALRLEQVQGERHLFEGLVLGHVVLPPAGRADYLSGNFEDACISTGQYLGAESFRYAVTGDAEAKRRADESAAALRKLQTITGTTGFFGRGFKTATGPTWDEECYFFPREWHQAGEYRWLGDPSSDSFNGRTFGWSCYFDLAADEAGKRLALEDVTRVVTQWIENDFRLVDIDGRMTLWGNFCPYILEEDLNALQALNHPTGVRVLPQRAQTRESRSRTPFRKSLGCCSNSRDSISARTASPATTASSASTGG